MDKKLLEQIEVNAKRKTKKYRIILLLTALIIWVSIGIVTSIEAQDWFTRSWWLGIVCSGIPTFMLCLLGMLLTANAAKEIAKDEEVTKFVADQFEREKTREVKHKKVSKDSFIGNLEVKGWFFAEYQEKSNEVLILFKYKGEKYKSKYGILSPEEFLDTYYFV